MRSGFIVFLIATLIFASGYFFYVAAAVCPIPIEYRVGAIDPRFGVTRDEVRTSVSNAESLWEDATGKNLFTYDEGAVFSINFEFDERQEKTLVEQNLREELDERKVISEDVREEYEDLVDQYQVLKDKYEAQSNSYERRLAEHNAEVAKWNLKGGAPEQVYEDLASRQTALAVEQRELNETASELNQLVREVNRLGDEGNVLVNAYNNVVETYNDNVGEGREFTQGDFQGNFINIYQFKDSTELELVLAHELGHALTLGHVENEKSVMFHFMGEQSPEDGITLEDMNEFIRVCGDPSASSYITFLQKVINQLRNIVPA